MKWHVNVGRKTTDTSTLLNLLVFPSHGSGEAGGGLDRVLRGQGEVNARAHRLSLVHASVTLRTIRASVRE